MRAPTQPTYDRSQSLFHRTPCRRLVKGPLSNMATGCYELKCMRENHELHIPSMSADPSPNLSFHHQIKLNQQWLCFVSQICSHQMYLQVRPFILSTLRKKSPYSSKLQTASRPLNRSLTFPVASVDPIRSWSFARGHCVHHTGKTVAGATQRIHVPTREVRPNPKQCFFFLVIKKDGWASC